jgi:ubiquinone/menaquinone biosynthesis C-methylase UbiE
VTTVSHPIFARMYRRFAVTAEAKGGSAYRDELLAGVSGRVIEVGAGHGLNFSHYPGTVVEVTAVEPEAYLRQGATEAAARAPVSIKLVDGVADALPFEDESFDVGVASLVLCSVSDQAAALGELRRVLRPGGELRFYEHVRAEEPKLARFQDRADRVWPIFGGGCHCNRHTLSAIGGAGFVVEEVRSFRFRPCVVAAPVVPHIIGRARRP